MDSRASGMRSDWPLIKHLSKTYSPKLGLFWQRLPLIELPITAIDEQERFRDVVLQNWQDRLYMPFDDFVMDIWQYNTDDGNRSLHTWWRMCRPDTYLRTRRQMSPWDVCFHPEIQDGVPREVRNAWQRIGQANFIIEIWTEHAGDLDLIADFNPTSFAVFTSPGAVQLGERMESVPISRGIVRALRNAPRCAPRVQAAVREFLHDSVDVDVVPATVFCSYLTMCPEYLVEETPQITPNGKHKKPDAKPWTNTYLPRIILLDPAEAPSGERGEHQGGTHASPRPHQRRGHWAKLKHPKYRRNEDGSVRQVFVKPAWVGSREWVMEGNRYRVIDPPSTDSPVLA